MILPPKEHTMTVPPPILASFLFAGCFAFAFTFGLLHGFGFASALSEVGLPQSAIPVALLFFNVGVEVGQLLFIASVFAVIALDVSRAAVGTTRSALRHRQCRRLLDHPASRRLLKND